LPPRKPAPVGAHVFVSGGLTSGLRYAEEIGAEALQVFVSNPRGWKQSAGDPLADGRFAGHCDDRRMPVFVHAPYLVNLASPTDVTRERSADAVRHSLTRGRRICARGVVVHAGSTVDGGARDVGLKQLREHLLPILDELSDDDPRVLVEPTAGGGQPIASTVQDLEPLFEALDRHPRLGICLDSCHLFASGTDVTDPDALDALLDDVDREIGLDRLRALHVNDSKAPLGSNRDRHENIGEGLLGDKLGVFLSNDRLQGLPAVLEVPGQDGHGPDADEVAKAKRIHKRWLRKAKR
jgi:deoxyribonuclease-4